MKCENFKPRVVKIRELLSNGVCFHSVGHYSQLNEEAFDSGLVEFNSAYSQNEKTNIFGDFNNLGKAIDTIMKGEKTNNWGDFNDWSQWADR